MNHYYLKHPVCGAYDMCVRTLDQKAKALLEIATCPECERLRKVKVGK